MNDRKLTELRNEVVAACGLLQLAVGAMTIQVAERGIGPLVGFAVLLAGAINFGRGAVPMIWPPKSSNSGPQNDN